MHDLKSPNKITKFCILINPSLYSWRDNSYVLQYCYVLDCKNNSGVSVSFENLAHHKNFLNIQSVETTLVGMSFPMESIILPPFRFLSKQKEN